MRGLGMFLGLLGLMCLAGPAPAGTAVQTKANCNHSPPPGTQATATVQTTTAIAPTVTTYRTPDTIVQEPDTLVRVKGAQHVIPGHDVNVATTTTVQTEAAAPCPTPCTETATVQTTATETRVKVMKKAPLATFLANRDRSRTVQTSTVSTTVNTDATELKHRRKRHKEKTVTTSLDGIERDAGEAEETAVMEGATAGG